MAGEGKQINTAFFTLTVPGAAVMTGFTEISGLDAECEAIEHRESNIAQGGQNVIRKVAGTWKFSDVTIKRAVDNDAALYTWHKTVADTGEVGNKFDCTITIHGTDHTPVAAYLLKQAWPKKYTPAAINAKENNIAVEEIVLAHEGFERTSA